MKTMSLHSGRVKILIVLTLMLAVFASAFGESFDDWYDDAAVVNTNLKSMGIYTVSVNTAANDYANCFYYRKQQECGERHFKRHKNSGVSQSEPEKRDYPG